MKGIDADLGFFAAGGKGATSRKAPLRSPSRASASAAIPQPLVYASRTAAKVDSAAVQDGYQLYHHVFFFTAAGDWCVVQQGMSDATRTARRYHWLSDQVDELRRRAALAVCCDARAETLNLVAHENERGAPRVGRARGAAARGHAECAREGRRRPAGRRSGR